MTLTITATSCPGLQVPDGRPIPPGLVMAWGRHAPGIFPVAVKIRQKFDPARATEYSEAVVTTLAALAANKKVCQVHLAIIPEWRSGSPDWGWIRHAVGLILRKLGQRPATGMDALTIYARLGNYKDGKNEGCTFADHVQFEEEFADTLASDQGGGGRILWSVGDDRGMVASLKGWRERFRIFKGGPLPACIEVQSYGATGTVASHIKPWKDSMREAGFDGELALVEHHRWFPGKSKTAGDLPELFTAETGEYLLGVARACRDAGVAYHLFTGDYAFGQDGSTIPNDAGMALFDVAERPIVKAWQPPVTKSLWQGWRLGA